MSAERETSTPGDEHAEGRRLPGLLGKILPPRELVESVLPPRPSFMPPLPGAPAEKEKSSSTSNTSTPANDSNPTESQSTATIESKEETTVPDTTADEKKQHRFPILEKVQAKLKGTASPDSSYNPFTGSSTSSEDKPQGLFSRLSANLPKPPFLNKSDKEEAPSEEERAAINRHRIKSLSLEQQNFIISAALAVGVLAYVVTFVVRFFRYLTGNLGVGQSVYPLSTFQTVLYLACLSLVAHRLAGYLLSLALRTALRMKFGPGTFDIHIGWLSYRGPLDKNQIVVHNLVWRNTPAFTRSPYLLRLHELRVALNPLMVMHILRDPRQPLVLIEEVIVDGLEIYTEKPSAQDEARTGGLNVWAATGRDNTPLHSLVQQLFSEILSKIKEKMAGRRSDTSSTEDGPPAPKIDLGRLLVTDVRVHVADLLSKESHLESSDAQALRIKALLVTRDDVTGPPATPGGDRTPLPAPKFGERLGDKVASAVLSDNATVLPRLVGAVVAANAYAAVTNARARLSGRNVSQDGQEPKEGQDSK